MKLPILQRQFRKAEVATVGFLGINLTENYQDGEFSDCKNLSTLHYPNLAQRKGRTLVEEYENVTDVFSWGDQLVVVDNGMLCVDGEPVVNVNEEPKQFAVVNTKLVVHPDMLCIDLTNNKVTDMKASYTSPAQANAVIFEPNKITFTLETSLTKDIRAMYSSSAKNLPWIPYTYTYGKDKMAVIRCWDEDEGNWDWSKLGELMVKTSLVTGRYDHGASHLLQDGDIIIPKKTELGKYSIVTGNMRDSDSEDEYDFDSYNTIGEYAVVRWDDDNPYAINASTSTSFSSNFKFDVYDAVNRQPLMSDMFKEGDIIDVTGTPFKLFDTVIDETNEDMISTAKLKIDKLDCDEETLMNVVTLSTDVFRVPVFARRFGEKIKATGTKGVRVSVPGESGKYLTVDVNRWFGENSAFIVYDTYQTGRDITVYEWNFEKRKFVNEYKGRFTDNPNTSQYAPYYASSSFQQYVDLENVKFQRAVPDLDFICERDNRLWGVSNKDKTIYASGLGLPWQFYDYAGTNMDSYAVAVGSGGDFTAIVNYNGILCFKENTLHKVLGNLPSEFYINTYEVPGVQKGAHMSAKAVNELLYYKSPNGIVNFTGYQPSNISRNLLMENTVKGVAASDGREYYVCVQAKDESHYSLFKYDMTTRLWLKEEDVEVHAMTRHNNNVYMAITTYREVESGGEMVTVTDRKLYVTGQENGEVVDWFARFKPFIEDVTINNSRRKVSGFARFILRFEMEPGSVLYVKTREDNGVWHTVWTRPATNKAVHTVPIRIGRCDKFEVELSGKGNVKIVSMKREVIADGKPNDVY